MNDICSYNYMFSHGYLSRYLIPHNPKCIGCLDTVKEGVVSQNTFVFLTYCFM